MPAGDHHIITLIHAYIGSVLYEIEAVFNIDMLTVHEWWSDLPTPSTQPQQLHIHAIAYKPTYGRANLGGAALLVATRPQIARQRAARGSLPNLGGATIELLGDDVDGSGFGLPV